MRPPASRLIDLQIDWFRQYAPEIELPGCPSQDVRPRIPRVDEYFSHTSVAFVSCGKTADLLPRVEAEFSGRILHGPEDLARFREDPSGLTWAVIAFNDMQELTGWSAALERLPALFDRGVRLFSPFPRQDRGLTDPGRDFLARLLGLSRPGAPRPILDLARAGREAMGEILDWFEARDERTERILLIDRGVSMTRDDRARFRSLGGLTAVSITDPLAEASGDIREMIEGIADLPYRGRAGFEGIAIATGFLEADRTLPGLGNAGEVVAWLEETFDPTASRLLIEGNGRKLIEAMAGESA